MRVNRAGLFYSVFIYLCSHGNDARSTLRTKILECSHSDWVKILVYMPKAGGQNESGCPCAKRNVKVRTVHSRPGLGFIAWLAVWVKCDELPWEIWTPRLKPTFLGMGISHMSSHFTAGEEDAPTRSLQRKDKKVCM